MIPIEDSKTIMTNRADNKNRFLNQTVVRKTRYNFPKKKDIDNIFQNDSIIIAKKIQS